MLLPVIMQRMSVLGGADPFALVGCGVALILIVLPLATWIIRKRKGAANVGGSSHS